MTHTDFDQWLASGIANGWVIPPVCATHDGLPISPEEEHEINEGHDPCIHVLRLCEPDQFTQIYENTPSMRWRDIP